MTKLYEDALRLSINENLRNIRLLLEWAEGTTQLEETIGHSKQALQLLAEVVQNLEELR
jgi:hypothetical protein